MDKVTVAEAARILNVSHDAVRKRIQRDTIAWDKDDEGRVFVYLDASDIAQDGVVDGVQDAYINALKSQVGDLHEQVSFLRAELVTRNEELRRKDHILAALTERLPELEATSEAPESSTPPAEESGGSPTPSDGARPGFWRRFFGVGV